MTLAGGGRMHASSSDPARPTVHTSSHPSFPPAQSQQVVQFLLARNYYLTALELLVESQQAGRGEEVEELHRFFSNTDKFPPDELSKHQNANALDVQSQAREREERLQLAEYELRLAKEDLAEVNKRLSAALEQTARTPQIVSVPSGAGSIVTTPHHRAGQPRASRAFSWPGGDASEAWATAEDAATPPAGKGLEVPDGVSPEVIHRRRTTQDQCHFEGIVGVDDSPTPTDQDLKVMNTAVVTYLVKHGYRMSAITLEEEAAGSIEEYHRGTVSSGGVSNAGHGHSHLHDVDLWTWLQASRVCCHTGVRGKHSRTASMQQLEHAQQVQQEVGKLKSELASSQKKIIELQTDLRELRKKSEDQYRLLQAVKSQSSSDSPRGAPFSSTAATCSPATTVTMSHLRSCSNDWPPVDPELHMSQSTVVAQLCDMLPRLVPNLTIKSRMEVLDLLNTVLLGKKMLEAAKQRILVGLVLNIVGSPDASQRECIVNHLVPISLTFGPSWTAVELLPMLVKQVSSPSSERRTLAAQILGACVDLLDLGTQAHVVLTQLHRLSEDRIEQVREAAVGAVTTLLSRMTFSKSYYSVVEDMIMALVRDPAEAIHKALIECLLPMVQVWVLDTDVIVTSLVPKVISEMGRHMQAASITAAQGAVGHGAPVASMSGMSLVYSVPVNGAAGASSSSASSSLPVSGYGESMRPSNRRFPNHDYQVVYQLLSLYICLQPALRHCALRNCPAWALETASRTYICEDPLACSIAASPSSTSLAVSSTAQAAEAVGRADAAAKPPMHPSGPPIRDAALEGAGPGSRAEDGAHRRSSTAGDISSLAGSQSRKSSGDGSIKSAAGLLASAGSMGRVLALVDATQQQDVPPQALFAVWAASEHHMQWKSMQWVVQFLIPELLDCAKMVTLVPETLELRLQFARSFAATCDCYGPQLTRQVIIPLLSAASGAQQTLQPTTPESILGEAVAMHIQEAAADLLPRNPESTRMCRERVLPLFFAGVLPPASCLGPYLSATLSSADGVTNRWVLDSLAEIHLAVDFACELRSLPGLPGQMGSAPAGSLVPELLLTLEQLVSCRSGAVSMCAVALLRGLLRTATSEQMSKRVMPSIMVMLGQGDAAIHTTCAWALLDVLLLFRDDTKLVEQVFVVYDGLLDSGSHEVQMTILSCGSHLASAIAKVASRSATAAVQLEWLLTAVQTLTRQFLGAGGGQPLVPQTPDQIRALASQLVTLVQQVHSFDVRLPRLQASLFACADALHKCRIALSEAQVNALAAILRDKATFSPGGITDSGQVHSCPPSTATSAEPIPGPSGASDIVRASEPVGMMSRFEAFRKKFRKDNPGEEGGAAGSAGGTAGGAIAAKPPPPSLPPGPQPSQQQPLVAPTEHMPSSAALLPPSSGMGDMPVHGIMPTGIIPPPHLSVHSSTRVSSKSFLSDDEDD